MCKRYMTYYNISKSIHYALSHLVIVIPITENASVCFKCFHKKNIKKISGDAWPAVMLSIFVIARA